MDSSIKIDTAVHRANTYTEKRKQYQIADGFQ